MSMHDDYAYRGLVGVFADFGDDSEQPSLVDVMRRRGMSDEEIFGNKDKLPKY